MAALFAFLLLLVTLATFSCATEKKSQFIYEENAIITQEHFESAFSQDGPSSVEWTVFASTPAIGQLFQYTEPICGLTLEQRVGDAGVAMITESCMQKIKQRMIGSKLDSFQIVYRCFQKNSKPIDPLNYQLLQAKVDKIGRDRGFWALFFTPVVLPNCSPAWMVDDGINAYFESNKELIDQLAEYIRLNGTESLTRAEYEEAFRRDALKAQFEVNGRITWIFAKSLFNLTAAEQNRLTPLMHCLVTMIDETRGHIKPNCSTLLYNYYHIDSDVNRPLFVNAILPYRCYLHDTPNDWELYVAPIIWFGQDEESPVEQHIIKYELPKTEHCSVRLQQEEDSEMTRTVSEEQEETDDEEYFHTEL